MRGCFNYDDAICSTFGQCLLPVLIWRLISNSLHLTALVMLQNRMHELAVCCGNMT